MKKIILMVFFLNLVQVYSLGIATGSKLGTYIKIGRDIKSVLSFPLEVYESKGSIENIRKLLKDKRIQFAIMQYDALLVAPKVIKKSVKNIKMVFPLYNEEIHLIANENSGIYDISDLKGKIVNIGEKESGTWVSSSLIAQYTKLNFIKRNDNTKTALKKLIKGEIDAMFFVVGKPASILKKFPLSARKKIRLVDIKNADLEKLYIPSQIEGGTYAWEKRNIKTYSVKSILATFNYKNTNQNEIKKMVKEIKENLEYLRKNGHQKWKEIDPMDYKKVKYPIHPKAKEIIENNKKKTIEEEMLEILLN